MKFDHEDGLSTGAFRPVHRQHVPSPRWARNVTNFLDTGLTPFEWDSLSGSRLWIQRSIRTRHRIMRKPPVAAPEPLLIQL